MSFRPCHVGGSKPLTRQEIDGNFKDLHEPLSALQVRAEADRCIYCYDAPCIAACPTSINIPTFIHQLRTDNVSGSAKTILSANIMGGTCARVCPTEVLCEQACVLNVSEHKPVEIGLLQRHAVDHLMASGGEHPFTRAPETGRRIAVVGAGPAGLSCAHRASMLGHAVVVFEANAKPGGLNEYGLAAYKMVDDFAQKEVEFLLGIGGIEIKYHQKLGDNLNLNELRDTFDAVYLAIGLGDTHALGIEGEDKDGVCDAVDMIAALRQAEQKADVAIGGDVIVIGAGNTAIDAAVQARRLGAENVTLVYRRGEQQMSATSFEVDLARMNGVDIQLMAAPKAIKGNGKLESVEFEHMSLDGGNLAGTGETFELAAGKIYKAIGQKLDVSALEGLAIDHAKIEIVDNYETSIAGVFAGGDCITSGEDLTVQAVEDGKQAALAINAYLNVGKEA